MGREYPISNILITMLIIKLQKLNANIYMHHYIVLYFQSVQILLFHDNGHPYI